MDLLDQTKKICELYNIWPSRSKGQNFLVNESVYDKIVEAAELTKEDLVLEIGPGLGFLTSRLAQKAGRVLAVELDDKLASYLSDALGDSDVENIEVVNKDILKLNFADHKLFSGNFKVVANLPYNITSFFLRLMISGPVKPSSLVLLLQKEVAERICAKPGDMSLLALSVQYYAEPEVLFNVSRRDFFPSPKVESAVIKIKLKKSSCDCAPDAPCRINSTCNCKSNRPHLTSPCLPRKEILCLDKGEISPSPYQGEGRGEVVFLPNQASSKGEGRQDESEKEISFEKRFWQLAKIGFSAKRKMLKNNLASGLKISPAEAEKLITSIGLDPKTRAEDLSVEDWSKMAKTFK